MWLCHDENQKHKIAHEEQQNRKGAAQRRKTGLLRWHVHRLHGKNLPGTPGRPAGRPYRSQRGRDALLRVRNGRNKRSSGLHEPAVGPGALRRSSRHGQAPPPLICQPNRGKNYQMPKMPKSVQWRSEPDFSTPSVVPRSAGFAAGQMGQTGALPIMFISSSQHHIFLCGRGGRQILQRIWQDMGSLAGWGHCSFDKIVTMTLMRFITSNACP